MTGSIITLTTDFGTRDGYVAQMKGVILGINPEARIVDITHEITPFQVDEAALVIYGAARYFTEGTVHVVVVDPEVGGKREAIVVRCRGSYFVGPDNGVFTLTADLPARAQSGLDCDARIISNPEMMDPSPSYTFHGRDIFAHTAARLSLGASFEKVGPPLHNPVFFETRHPIYRGGKLEGSVIYIDRFGNLTTNIREDQAQRIKLISVGRTTVTAFGRTFSEVRHGHPIALINSFGLLEIAVNCGNARQETGVVKGDSVIIEFEGQDV